MERPVEVAKVVGGMRVGVEEGIGVAVFVKVAQQTTAPRRSMLQIGAGLDQGRAARLAPQGVTAR